MFGNNMGSFFSLGKIIGGLNKTLGIVNQVIPIYKEAKPLVGNAKSAINFLKQMTSTTTTRVMNNAQKNIAPIKEKIVNANIISDNKKGPTFFQ